VANWHKWDPEIEWSQCEEGFVTNSRLVIKPKNAPVSKAFLSECIPNKNFTVKTKPPLTQIHFQHWIDEKNGSLIVTHKVNIQGALTFLFKRLIGSKVKASLPLAMDRMLKLAKTVNTK